MTQPWINDGHTCFHEAGHAVAFWHYGIGILYVRVRTEPDSPHWGETRAEDRGDIEGVAALENEMRAAAAGRIAVARTFLSRQLPTDNELIKEFEQAASVVARNPNHPHDDILTFARMAGSRDDELREADFSALTGPTGWVRVWHEAENLIRAELWAIVRAVADELRRSLRDYRQEDVERIAAAVTTGIYYAHAREEHPDMWQRWCNDQRRFNALAEGTPRKVDGTLLLSGEDVSDI